MGYTRKELYELLESKYDQYDRFSFIEDDPVSIPHLFEKKEDIEISGFFAAIIAWGQRPTIIKNANKLVEWMDYRPYEFVVNFSEKDLKPFKSFKHRTFNGTDCVFFLLSLQNIYRNYGGLEKAFYTKEVIEQVKHSIISFRQIFFQIPHEKRSEKHISSPLANSSCKRLNLFLRWMVRKDSRNVDFGIWNSLTQDHLLCPLDVHSGNIARKLGLLKRKQNDWKSVIELTNKLKIFDPHDPVKYDYSLFGTGVYERL